MGPQLVHASTVAADGRGVLILGPSGSGKSALALQLMAYGCDLVADDQTLVTARDGVLTATCPPTTRGLIEARGFGLLQAPPCDRCQIVLAVDLGQTNGDRLPLPRRLTLLGCDVDLAFGPVTAHFPAAVLHYLRHGRAALDQGS